MKHLQRWLGGLLVLALGVRLAADLLEPVIPLLVVLFTLVALFVLIFGGRGLS